MTIAEERASALGEDPSQLKGADREDGGEQLYDLDCNISNEKHFKGEMPFLG